MTESGGRILLVEDDDNLRLTLAEVLRDEGYSIATAADVAGARSMLASASFDVVVLDVMLPDGDGYSLCTELKKRAHADVVPRVLMLTARTLEDDLVRGFDAGADDYLKKPYRLRELLVRVRALARRGSAPADAGTSASVVALGAVTVDRTARKVLDDAGAEIAMTRTELDLLVLFIDNAGVALSRNDILDRVWGKDVVVDERTVDNFVSSLKKKLKWTPTSPFSIRTVRGVGYRMDLA